MKSIKILFTVLISILMSTGCKKDHNDENKTEKPFVITEFFVGGTLTPASKSYTSVFFINFLENNKAVFISSGNNLTGDYILTDNELVFEVKDPNNYRLVKFSLDKDKKITSAYYKALTTEYAATGDLIPVTESNQLSGKTFKGEEFKMGPVTNRQGLIYNFNKTSTTYGSGTEAATIDNTLNSYTLINGCAFKYVNGSTTELGFVTNKKLTVFRYSGLYYFGKYDQQ
ncbi:hypothetical protein [Pedobacter sp.]|uniref:hypothetical protein n=1 Tax=Pedobacter sp. TaxID=1411316 RepID=UPI00396CF26D